MTSKRNATNHKTLLDPAPSNLRIVRLQAANNSISQLKP